MSWIIYILFIVCVVITASVGYSFTHKTKWYVYEVRNKTEMPYEQCGIVFINDKDEKVFLSYKSIFSMSKNARYYWLTREDYNNKK